MSLAYGFRKWHVEIRLVLDELARQQLHRLWAEVSMLGPLLTKVGACKLGNRPSPQHKRALDLAQIACADFLRRA